MLSCCSVCVGLWLVLCFFFKQKTAYELRISDWSSDVCSSDLNVGARVAHVVERAAVALGRFDQCRLVAQPVVKARGDVESGVDRRDGVADEVVAHLAPRIGDAEDERPGARGEDRKSTRLNSSH